MKTLLFSISLITLLLSGTAQADQIGVEGRPWIQKLRAAARSGDMTLGALDLSSNVLPPAIRTRIAQIADDQFQIWGDTILEGDFIAANELRVDAIETVHVANEFAGYRVTYSAEAYETGHCDPKRNLAQCEKGRISEATYIAPSLDIWARDDQAFAEFSAE